MRSEFILAINQLCAERRLSPDVVMDAVQAALVSAYKRDFGGSANVDVKIEPGTGIVRVFAAKQVVESVQDPKAEILLSEARRVDPQAQLGSVVQVETTPRDFGRIATQTAKQVILQRIREAEREALYTSFANTEGEIAHGTVQSIDFHSGDLVVALDGAEALLPAKEQVPTERYKRGMRIRAYVLEVKKGPRGPQITLSRRSPLFLRRLLEVEVPEIHNGAVEIKSIAREAGSRSKVAVHATQEGVDPVGSCVGVRGQRIHNVVTELGGEKIDVVQWSADPAVYIANALGPAKVMNVILEGQLEGEDGSKRREGARTATVIVPDRHQSLAIGKEGQNARLAAKLTGWRIDIKSATEAAEETLGRLKDRVVAPEEADLLALAEAILQTHDESGLSAEERELVEREVEQSRELGVPWPEEVPALAPRAALAEAAGDDQRAAGQVEPVVRQEPEEGMPSLEEGPERAEEAGDKQKAWLAAAEEEATMISARRPLDDEAAHEPTFEGEPIEDSIGWVRTEPQEDLYSGWEETIEDLAPVGDDWDREEPGVAEAPWAGKKGKKKKSSKSRFVRGRGGEDWGDW